MLRHLIMAAAGILMCMLSWVQLSAGEEDIVPFADAASYDFGVVEIDGGQAVIDWEFDVTNTSTHPLRILKVSTTCGCTGANVDRDLIPPGESAKLRAELTLSETGLVQADVKLATDSPEYPVLTYSISAFGLRSRGIQASTRYVVNSESDGATTIELVLVEGASGDAPPMPVIKGDGSEFVEFSGWLPVCLAADTCWLYTGQLTFPGQAGNDEFGTTASIDVSMPNSSVPPVVIKWRHNETH